MVTSPRRFPARHSTPRALFGLIVALAALVAGCGQAVSTLDPGATTTPGRSPASSTSRPTPSPTMPRLQHVYLILMENEDYSSVIGSSDAPYINSLISSYGLATNYSSVAHPSQPNYIALFSGSTQGIADDNPHDISATNLVDQLESHGLTWRVFAQNVPSGCFTGASAQGGTDGSGTYARKHNPAISFTDISGNPARCANITSFRSFNPSTANFELIIPDLCNDMHDCGVATGDAFLKSFVPKITQSPAFTDSVLFILWDESRNESVAGGRVPAIVVSPYVRPGFTSKAAYDHYSVLRSIEDAWGLGCLGHACSAPNMAEFLVH